MAKLNNFIYCLNVNTTDGRTDITGVLSAFNLEYIPGLFSFSVSFTLLDLSEGEHWITIKFISPDKETISLIDNVKVNYKKDPSSNLPDQYLGINVAAGLQNVHFKKSGMYATQVLLDGDVMGTFDIFAKGKNE